MTRASESGLYVGPVDDDGRGERWYAEYATVDGVYRDVNECPLRAAANVLTDAAEQAKERVK